MTDKLREADRMNTTDKIMAMADDVIDHAWNDGMRRKDKFMGERTLAARQALRAEIDALVRDAERYRWLCSYTIIPAPSLWDNGVGFVTPALPRKSGAMNKQELDTAIDAMQEKQS